MKHLLITTAFVALTTAPLHAGTETEANATQDTQATFMMQDATYDLSNLMGARVYIPSPDAEAAPAEAELTEPHESWEDIGEIGEAYLTNDGDISSLIVDVGGFLGIGERQVQIDPSEVTFKPDADDEGAFFVVYNGPLSDLEGKEEFDQASVEGTEVTSAREKMAEVPAETALATETASDSTAAEAEADIASNDATAETEMASDKSADAMTETEAEVAQTEAEAAEDVAAAEEATEQAATETTEQAAAEADAVSDSDAKIAELTADDRSNLTADDLQGLAVYDANEEHVGEISELVLADDGKITDVVIDVGGFLGIGEKPVAMAFDDLKIMRLTEGGLTASTAATMEELEAMESWEG